MQAPCFKISNKKTIEQVLKHLQTVQEYLADKHMVQDTKLSQALSYLNNPINKQIVRDLYWAEFNRVKTSYNQIRDLSILKFKRQFQLE